MRLIDYKYIALRLEQVQERLEEMYESMDDCQEEIAHFVESVVDLRTGLSSIDPDLIRPKRED